MTKDEAQNLVWRWGPFLTAAFGLLVVLLIATADEEFSKRWWWEDGAIESLGAGAFLAAFAICFYCLRRTRGVNRKLLLFWAVVCFFYFGRGDQLGPGGAELRDSPVLPGAQPAG